MVFVVMTVAVFSSILSFLLTYLTYHLLDDPGFKIGSDKALLRFSANNFYRDVDMINVNNCDIRTEIPALPIPLRRLLFNFNTDKNMVLVCGIKKSYPIIADSPLPDLQ